MCLGVSLFLQKKKEKENRRLAEGQILDHN